MKDWITSNRRYLAAWGSYLAFGLLLRLLWVPIIRVFFKLMPSGIASHPMVGPTLLWLTTALMWVASFFVFRFIIQAMIERHWMEREQNTILDHIPKVEYNFLKRFRHTLNGGKKMRKRQYVIAAALLVAAGMFAEESESRFRIRFVNAPLHTVLADYAEKSGKHIETVEGVRATLTITTETGETLTLPELLKLFEKQMNEVNIGLFPISTNRLVATWVDPSKAPHRTVITVPGQTSSAERLRQLRAEIRKGAATNTPLSGEAIQKQLRQYQINLMRQGRAPMPIPLTKEVDDQLMKEGILPPLENAEKAETFNN